MSSGPPAPTRINALLEQYQGDFSLTLGVSARKLGEDAPPAVAFQDDMIFPAASTIKLYVLTALLQAVADGQRQLDDEITLGKADQVGGSGVLRSLSAGRAWTLRDLATLMIIVSDNAATNLLIGLLGVERINDYIGQHSWNDTNLIGKLALPGRRVSSTTSPRDLADCMERLWQGELLPEAETAIAREILLAQHYTDTLGREIGFDAYSDAPGISIASKCGSITGVRNEVGIISRGGQAFVIAAMSKDATDVRFWANNPGNLALMRTSRLLFEHYLGEP